MIRVVIVDDHPVVRTGVALMLNVQDDIEVVAAVSDAESAVQAVVELSPDVVLMDLSMPGKDGASATRDILTEDERVAVVVLTSFSDEDQIQNALDAGAVGYLLKDSEPRELVGAVRAASRGESPLHPKAARVALQRRATSSVSEGLSAREQEVLLLVTQGLTNGQIARRLRIAERTVKGHLTHIYERLGVSDRTSAALWAERNLRDPR